jgi:hypothetical protein
MPRTTGRQIAGGEALSNALARSAPKRTAASPLAMFRTMERSDRGRGFLDSAGVSATTRTQLHWLSGETQPSAKNSQAIKEAYDNWSAANLSHRHGNIIEIYPSSSGADQYGRPVRAIAVTNDELAKMIKAAHAKDTDGLNRLWNTQVDLQILDSPPGKAYHTVSHVVFSGV